MVSEKGAVIEIQGLTAGYGEEVILREVSFAVNEGEVFAVLGGSGCGKSTLLRHILGLLPPRAGAVKIRGVDVHRAGEKETARLRRDMGVLFQSGALFGSMTVAENVALPLHQYTDLPEGVVAELVAIKLSLVGLEGFGDRLPSELSGGMKKRAGLARAMALDPTILFFDEPSAGLDPVASAELDELILGLNAGLGTTMVIVTHELASILSVAGRAVMLDREARGVIAEGRPAELRDRSGDPRVRAFFHRRAPEKGRAA
jgi:phospholipid/cholesterol/gamma-HCH transport system ATP-binding protein